MNSAAPVALDVVLDDAHRYWLGDRELDGCTSTLKAVGLIDPTLYTEEARQRGQYVHEIIHADLEGDLVTESVDPELVGYTEAARRYLIESGVEILALERPLGDPVRGIAGKPDIIGRVTRRGFQRCIVLDWKTGSYAPWHRFQSAWYEHLARCYGLVAGLCDREAVYLRPDGTYDPKPFTDRADWAVAQAAITVRQAMRLR